MTKVYFCKKYHGLNRIKINLKSIYKMKIIEIRISTYTRRNYQNSMIEFWIKQRNPVPITSSTSFLLNKERINVRRKYIRYIPNTILCANEYLNILSKRFNNRIYTVTISGYKMVS